MATTKISATVDSELLERIKRLHRGVSNLSAILDAALREHLHRHEMLAVLTEMERQHPVSDAGKAAGEKLCQSMQSSSTPARSARSRTNTKPSASRSVKR